jgi:hypothetical protein
VRPVGSAAVEGSLGPRTLHVCYGGGLAAPANAGALPHTDERRVARPNGVLLGSRIGSKW